MSVSSQRDSELAELGQEKRELAQTPEAGAGRGWTALYEAEGYPRQRPEPSLWS